MQFENSRPNTGAEVDDVQRFFLARARRGLEVGPFRLLLSGSDSSPYGNYAIPLLGAEPTADDIARLEEAFLSRERIPRLEFVPSAAPLVEPTLLAAGFEVEMRPPLMTCRTDAAPVPAEADGFVLSFADEPAELDLAVAVQAEALDGSPDEARWMADLPRRGGRVALARDAATSAPAGVGASLKPQEDVTELVGIGVAPRFRRRGLGRAMTAFLAQSAFEAGCGLTFLSATGEAQAAIYARAGFTHQPPMLFISKRSK